MKSVGKRFEDRFYRVLESKGIYWHSFRDYGGIHSGQDIRFMPTNPYDCFFIVNGIFIALELKSTNQMSLSIGKKKMIKPHQVFGLNNVFSKGHIAGFLIEFRGKKETWLINIKDFLDIMMTNDKQSISYYEICKVGFLISNDFSDFFDIILE